MVTGEYTGDPIDLTYEGDIVGTAQGVTITVEPGWLALSPGWVMCMACKADVRIDCREEHRRERCW